MSGKNTLDEATLQTLEAYKQLKRTSKAFEIESNFRIYTVFKGQRQDLFRHVGVPKSLFHKAYTKLKRQGDIWPTRLNGLDVFVLATRLDPAYLPHSPCHCCGGAQ